MCFDLLLFFFLFFLKTLYVTNGIITINGIFTISYFIWNDNAIKFTYKNLMVGTTIGR